MRRVKETESYPDRKDCNLAREDIREIIFAKYTIKTLYSQLQESGFKLNLQACAPERKLELEQGPCRVIIYMLDKSYMYIPYSFLMYIPYSIQYREHKYI